MRRIAPRGLFLTTALSCFLVLHFVNVVQSRTQKNPVQTNPDAGELYMKNCATCHGKDGRAKTLKAKFSHARNLTDPQWQVDVTDEHLFNSISNGKGKMPAWKKKLSEAEINALVAYVRTLKQ